jgi:multidrug resistance efflux pump
VTGTIEKMPVVLGAHVRTGDLLVQIAAGELSARMTQAKTRLEQADRNLARERKTPRKKGGNPGTRQITGGNVPNGRSRLP